MSESTWRAYLKTVLESVANIGVVHDYERWATLRSDFISKFKATIGGEDVVRGWTISCTGFANESIEHDEHEKHSIVIRAYTFKIRGYFTVDDASASEKTAWALITAVAKALDLDDTIHGEDESYGSPPGVTVDTVEHHLFNNELVHYVEMTQVVKEMECLK